MKIVFLILGFLFLGASFAWTFATEAEPRLAGGLEWRCDPPTESVQHSECWTTSDSDTFLRIDTVEVSVTICLGFTGVGCMVAAAAVGNRPPAPKPTYQQQQPQAAVGGYPPR